MTDNNPQYGNYSQGGGYGQSNPYSQQGGGYNNQAANPYNDDVELNQYGEPAPAPAGRYEGGGLPSGPRLGGGGGYNSGGGGYEGAGYGNSGGNAGGNILNQCRDIDQAIDDLGSRLQDLKVIQSKVLQDRAQRGEVDRTNSETLAAYKNLGERLKKIKSNPQSGSPTNAPQVGRVDRKLKKAINDFQRLESDFRGQMQEAQIRQVQIVDQDITPEDARKMVEDPQFDGQVFSQAVSTRDAAISMQFGSDSNNLE
jgi:syntaxin 1B/2/3